jgi:hypothetical protein
MPGFLLASLIVILAATGCPAFAEGSLAAEADSVGSALRGISRVTEVTGGLVTLGFGIWHFFIPSMFGWYGYLQDDPAELSRAIGASNFFLSFSLCLIGATSVSIPLLFADAGSVNTAWLWTNVGLWTARSVYQAVAPQGSQVKGLSQAMLAGFIATDLLFLFSALVSTLHG